jgi:hypothetical protein
VTLTRDNALARIALIVGLFAWRAHLGAGGGDGPAVHRCDQHGYCRRRHKRELAKPRDELTTIIVVTVLPFCLTIVGHGFASSAPA